MMKKIILTIALAITLFSCNEDEATTNSQNDGLYSSGFFVTNEGNFQSNNADVTYINADFSKSENQIFKNANNRSLGDVAQSLTQNTEYVFVVMNNSNTIEIVEKNTFKAVKTITENINSPRFATISNGKLWVTNSGNNTVSYYNISDFSAAGTISLDFSPEFIEATNETVYVTTNPWNTTHKINSYQVATATLKNVETFSNPINGLTKNNNEIFILTSGETTQLFKANESNYNLLEENTDTNSRFLVYENNHLYYTSGLDIKKYNIPSNLTSTLFSVPDSGWSAIYGFNVFNDKIYIADAKSFSEAGEIVIYNLNGQALKNFKTGIGPNAIYKIQ